VSKTEIAEKFKEYLETVQDSYPNEYYATDRALAASFIGEFLTFINVKYN
jgi:hypothetical protein